MTFNEHDILLSIKKGNLQGFRRLFDNYYKMLCNIATGYLNDKHAAEEVVDDVFYKLWELRISLDIHTSIKAYLIRAVRNKCLNCLEQNKLDRYFFNDLLYNETNRENISEANYDTPLSDLVTNDLEDAVNKAIESLPNECREIFRLSRFENLKYEEIARQRNISVNTVKTQMKIALQKLRQALAGYIS